MTLGACQSVSRLFYTLLKKVDKEKRIPYRKRKCHSKRANSLESTVKNSGVKNKIYEISILDPFKEPALVKDSATTNPPYNTFLFLILL